MADTSTNQRQPSQQSRHPDTPVSFRNSEWREAEDQGGVATGQELRHGDLAEGVTSGWSS